MPNPIKAMAKLTCGSKQIDGMGFGGGAKVDNLEVAGTLGMKNPDTGEKLYRNAYNLARFAYCGDEQVRGYVRAALYNRLLHEDKGKIAEDTILRLVFASIREFTNPATIINKDGEQEIVSYSKRRIAKILNIKHQSISDRHEKLYNICVEQLNIWSNDAVSHIKSHYREDEL